MDNYFVTNVKRLYTLFIPTTVRSPINNSLLFYNVPSTYFDLYKAIFREISNEYNNGRFC